jgi:hypothetical protein
MNRHAKRPADYACDDPREQAHEVRVGGADQVDSFGSGDLNDPEQHLQSAKRRAEPLESGRVRRERAAKVELDDPMHWTQFDVLVTIGDGMDSDDTLEKPVLVALENHPLYAFPAQRLIVGRYQK